MANNIISRGLDTAETLYNSNGGTLLSGDAVKGGYFVTDTLENIPSWANISGTLCYCTGTEESPVNKFYQFNGATWIEKAFVVSEEISEWAKATTKPSYDLGEISDTTSYVRMTPDERTNLQTAHSHATSPHNYIPTNEKGAVNGVAELDDKGKVPIEQLPNAFSKIAVSGQTTVEADGATDTLELVAGENIIITTDATNNKVNISSKQAIPYITTTLNKNSTLAELAAFLRNSGISATAGCWLHTTETDGALRFDDFIVSIGDPFSNGGSLINIHYWYNPNKLIPYRGNVSTTQTISEIVKLVNTQLATESQDIAGAINELNTDIGNIIDGPSTVKSAQTAGTADVLSTARTISLTGDIVGSASFDGSSDIAIDATAAKLIGYGTCSTAGTKPEKEVKITDQSWGGLRPGCIIGVKFSYNNSATNCKLNVNKTGAKTIYYGAEVYPGVLPTVCGQAGHIIFYMFNGTHWVWLNINKLDDNTDTVSSVFCNTSSETAAKVGACTYFKLNTKSYVHVNLTNTNTYAGAITLNINNTGAKPIYLNGSPTSSSNYNLTAGTYIVYYDGTNFYFRTDGKLTADITGNAATANDAQWANEAEWANEADFAYNDEDGNNIVDTYQTKADTSQVMDELESKIPVPYVETSLNKTNTLAELLAVLRDNGISAGERCWLNCTDGNPNNTFNDVIVDLSDTWAGGNLIAIYEWYYPSNPVEYSVSSTSPSTTIGEVMQNMEQQIKMSAIPRPESTTDKAIVRYNGTEGEIQNSKIIIEDVTNTRDTSKKAQVLSIPADGGKKVVYGYCTDQVDGTSFIGGLFDANATEYPYSQGLAIGGTSGNLLWKGEKVATSSDITKSNIGLSNVENKSSETIRSEITANNITSALNYTPADNDDLADLSDQFATLVTENASNICVFNDTINIDSLPASTTLSFVSNGVAYSKIERSSTGTPSWGVYSMRYNNISAYHNNSYTPGGITQGWTNANYKTIYIADMSQASDEFKTWLNANATVSTAANRHPVVNVTRDSSSSSTLTYGGSFTAVESIVKDTLGHIEQVTTKQLTLPSALTSIDKLTTSRYLDGISFNGSDDLTRYAVCNTDKGIATKVVTISTGRTRLQLGTRVTVHFKYGNTAEKPGLVVGNATDGYTDVKLIYWQGKELEPSQYWPDYSLLDFVYNGAGWEIVGAISASKVEASDNPGDGKIKIDDQEVTVYEHPAEDHLPSGGANGKILGYSSTGATWIDRKTLTVGSKSFNGSEDITIEASDLGLAAAMKFLGTSSTTITDGATTNPITISAKSTNVTAGNVVLYDGYEYVWTGSAWEQLGQEGSFSLNNHVHGNITTEGALGAASTVVVTDSNKKIIASTITTTELAHLNGVTSNIQGQLNGKAAANDLSTHTSNTTAHITAAERTKWDKGEANQNAFSNIAVGSTTIAADNTTDTLTLEGSNVTLTPNTAKNKLTIGITKDNVTTALGYTPPETNTTYSNATTSAAGLMSIDDKTKLNGIAANANNYSHPSTAGNKHVPSGGEAGKFLGYGGSSGTAAWTDLPYTMSLSGNTLTITIK